MVLGCALSVACERTPRDMTSDSLPPLPSADQAGRVSRWCLPHSYDGLERSRVGVASGRTFFQDGNSERQGSARFPGFNVHASAKLTHAFAHSWHANSRAAGLDSCQPLGRNSLAPVKHFQHQLSFLTRDANLCFLALRMPVDVGQALLNESKYHQFDVAWKPTQTLA